MKKLAGGFIFLMSIGAGGKLETTAPGQPERSPPPIVGLRTRPHPFAAYVTSMHKQFHEQWIAFITQTTDKNAWVKLAIAVAPDGKLARVTLVRPSGDPAVDQAALAIVKGAAPFAKPPSTILSADGLVHLDWELHTDEPRACSTINVDPHLLDANGRELAPSPRPAIR
jgi:TonB family protein